MAATVEDRLGALMARDERRLGRRIAAIRRERDAEKRAALLAEVERDITGAEAVVERRRRGVPTPTYPASLPVSERKDDILAALRDNQVVVVAGETGSGKSTQLPKICLELGRGVRGMIGHTQPRRIAARSVAERVAEELGTELGGIIGYTVRFTDRASDETLVRVMTDGILLAEIQRDRQLERYDTLIVDEAHERSLNIDFILGYLAQLLPRRRDLKVVITSATIDTERFSRHFDDAPVVEVSGRTYPVEVRYRPLADDETDRDQTEAVCDAIVELSHEGPGDILVFLSGEREIRDTAEAVRQLKLRDVEIMPLYARLSAAEQHRVFAPHAGRRVVLATNVAETSLTVPGIRYVVDAGTARISRYSRRTKVQRLPIEKVSQAAASQRAGRCGRVAPGVCIRLYDEEDFESRPEFTEPEILRTHLASVILQMAALGLGDVNRFPFIDPPDARNIADGIDLLEELGALDPDETEFGRRLTPLGRKLAQLPLDPRLGRMVLEADRNACVRDVMVIAAGLSIQDPRERPVEKRQAADEFHSRFADPSSDFLSYLRLWEFVREQQSALSSSQFRRLCKAEYLNHLRVREWQDIYSQLRQIAGGVGIRSAGEPERTEEQSDRVHRSLLAGLLSHIGLRDAVKQDYLGARNARFAISPGSALFDKPPRWVMAAELVETTRLWARVNARIRPEWIEGLAGHLVKRTHGEPWWDRDRGAATTEERVTLYGVPIVERRRIDYARIDPVAARELFIGHALVERDWETHHAFFADNARLVAEVHGLEDKVRRRDLLVDDRTLYAFFGSRLPAEVSSAQRFDRWWNGIRRDQPDLLSYTLDVLVRPGAGRVDPAAYPDTWRQDDLTLDLSYVFDPTSPNDGVTVDIPLPVLNRVEADGFDWHVPGLREEMVTALIRSLPKDLRRNFAPAPDHARAFLEQATPADGPLLETLSASLARTTGVVVPPVAWSYERIPPHLRMGFRVIDEAGLATAFDRDLDSLKARMRHRMRAWMADAARSVERQGLRSWNFGRLPKAVEATWGGHAVRAYPALVDEGETVAVRVVETEEERDRLTAGGTRRLLQITLPTAAKAVRDRLGNRRRLQLGRLVEDVDGLIDEAVRAALDALMAEHGGPPFEEAAFVELRDFVRRRLVDAAVEVVALVEEIVTVADAIEARLDRPAPRALEEAHADVRDQLDRLLEPGFVVNAGARRLPDILRYLRATERRLEKLPDAPGRDAERMRRVRALEERRQRLAEGAGPRRAADVAVIGWMLEELRVSEFAQALGTSEPVSVARVERALEQLELGRPR